VISSVRSARMNTWSNESQAQRTGSSAILSVMSASHRSSSIVRSAHSRSTCTRRDRVCTREASAAAYAETPPS
jgi:hypothetical protein